MRMLDNLGTYKIDYADYTPTVAVVASSLADAQVKQLREMTDYPSFTVIAAAADSVNDVAKRRSEDVIVLLNGMKPTDGTWLREMVNYARPSSGGGVGGKVCAQCGRHSSGVEAR